MTDISTKDSRGKDAVLVRFENGDDLSDVFDFEHPIMETPIARDDTLKQVSTSLPSWLVDFMDTEASRRGISRKAVINDWLVDRADLEMERRRKFA